MDLIDPILDILPEPQKVLWPELTQIPQNFVLYGGTALSLQLGHRHSVDFDFFSDKSVNKKEIIDLPCFKKAEIIQDEKETLSLVVFRLDQKVQLSFFGGLTLGRISNPKQCRDNNVKLASLIDVAAQKMAVVQTRGTFKDYFDVATLIKTGITLEQACGAAIAMYQDFDHRFSLKALTYFEDGDLKNLSSETRQTLIRAVQNFQQPEEMLKQSDFLYETSKVKFKHSSKRRFKL